MKIKFTVILLVCSVTCWANNIVVSNVNIASQNTSLKYKMIKMDVTWQNSWRTYTNESNYDAAWIFIKYRKQSEAIWKHATFHYINGISDGHLPSINSEINTPADGKGVFVFRANSSPTNFIGTATYNNMEVRWNYGVDGLADTDLVEIAVFAIEMVYVPQGSFYVGDGITATSSTVRFQNGAASSPFNVVGEGQLTLGGSASGNLSTPQTTTTTGKDDFTQTVTKTLPAAFPKGYKAFYCMKYEVSQEQYAEFLKKLTSQQTANRYPNFFGQHRYTIDASFNATAPNRACNYLRWHDGVAYADWAGLRPMTELEYEKACRGPASPVPGEFAWGNTTFRTLTSFASDGTASETDGNSPRANVHYNQGTSWDLSNPLFGPVRCGWTTGGTRENSGDTYYGITDMSGNLEEATVGVGIATNRNYTGTHGDGNLSSAGHANNLDWPGYDGTTSDVSATAYVRFRGGSIFGVPADPNRFDALQVSKRTPTNTNIIFWDAVLNAPKKREPYFGFRGVRSAN